MKELTKTTDSAKNHISNKIAYEVKSLLVEPFELIRKIYDYFPARLLLFSFVFSYLFLVDNSNFLLTLESQIMKISLSFFHLYLLIQPQHFEIGGTTITFSIYSQILFLMFFPSLAFAAKTSMLIRLKILGFGLLYFFVMIALQLVTISVFLFMKIPNFTSLFLNVDMILSTIAGAFVIELALFTVLTLPKRTKITPIIPRNYVAEWCYFGLALLSTVLIFQFIFQYLQISVNSVVGVFASLSVLNMLTYSKYVGFALAEIRVPEWARLLKKSKSPFNPDVTFLLAAYNEEEFIGRTIVSIDRAAARYSGRTTILVIDDGSTDSTAKILAQNLSELKHCTGTFITIPNAGKGNALNYGLNMVKGDIIFRIDADSTIKEHTIPYMVRHFIDPQVSSVGGMILALDDRSIWQKTFNISSIVFSAFKKYGEMSDSMVIQSGAFSVFRKEALIRAGGWVLDQNGEDGEITVRLGRLGYRNEYDDVGIVFSDVPKSAAGIRKQRMRWAAAYYHSRIRNMNIIKEFNGPRSIFFLLNVFGHGFGIASSLFWPFFFASILAGNIGDIGIAFFPSHHPGEQLHPINLIKTIEFIIAIPAALVIVDISIWSLHYFFIAYMLFRYKKLRQFKYAPLLRIYWIVAGSFPRLETLSVLLSWSSRWKIHNKESYKYFLKDIKRAMDTYSS